ncbi:MAG: sulfite exporter TauE/SafE family protein, partial [Actinomycetota bacterium]
MSAASRATAAGHVGPCGPPSGYDATLIEIFTVAIGGVLGFLIGLTGVGGGALVAPALYVILGMTYTEAVAASLVYSVFTKIVGFVQHQRQGTVLWHLAILYGLPAIPGAVIGSQLLYAFESAERLFALVMSGVLVIVAVFLLLEANIRRINDREKPFSPDHVGARGAVAIGLVAFAVGILLGITSIGSGSIIILSMVLLFRM